MAMRVSNVWRSLGHHKSLHATCLARYGPDVAALHCTTCIGKLMRQRWGSCDGPERKPLRGKIGIGLRMGQLRADGVDGVVPPFLVAVADHRPMVHRGIPPQLAIQDIEAVVRPEDVTIDWAGFFRAALKVKPTDVATAISMDIDGESATVVMRTRAGRTHRDLSKTLFWVYTIISQANRSPMSHALFAIEQTKRDWRKRPDVSVRYLRRAIELIDHMAASLHRLLQPDTLNDDGYWGKLLAMVEGSAGDVDANVGDAGDTAVTKKAVIAMIRKAVAINLTEVQRRFGEWRCASDKLANLQARYVPFRYLMAESPETRKQLLQHLLGARSRNQTNDCFMGKMIDHYAEEINHEINTGGDLPGVGSGLMNLFHTIDHELEGDVKGIESQSSILGVMTTRCRWISRDLLSSRHVIHHNDRYLVSTDTYTDAVMNEAELVARHGARHDRFQSNTAPPCVAPESAGSPVPILRMEKRRLPTTLKITTLAKAAVDRVDIVVLEIVGHNEPHLRTRPWDYTMDYRRAPWGLDNELAMLEGDVGSPDCVGLVSLGTDALSLFALVQTLVEAIPQWPPPTNLYRCNLHVATMDWTSQSAAGVSGWECQILADLPLPNIPVDDRPFPYEHDLADILEGGGTDDDDEDAWCPGEPS